jgi:hypothetical protein
MAVLRMASSACLREKGIANVVFIGSNTFNSIKERSPMAGPGVKT